MEVIDSKEKLILIVDDLPDNISILGKILQKEGFKVSFATNAKQTMNFLNKNIPDLILLDIMLPDISGFEICKNIKNIPELQKIPVIFLSAKIDADDKIKGFSLGGVDYITKPFNSLEVSVRVKTHLNLKLYRETVENINKDLENMLELRTKELILKERQAVIGELLQGIVHNMKSPLTGIFFSTDMAKVYLDNLRNNINEQCFDNLNSLDDQKVLMTPSIEKNLNNLDKHIENIILTSKRLNDMINNLMTKSLSSNSNELKMVDLNFLVKQEIDFLDADLVFKHHIQKVYSLSDNPLNVVVISSEISQVIHNLIRNAIDAMYKVEEKKITIQTFFKDDFVYFSVKDSGPGIPENVISRIFEPFFTTKNTDPNKTDEPLGTGLGLHFCKQTISNLNGEIYAENNPDGGAHIYFRIPQKERLS